MSTIQERFNKTKAAYGITNKMLSDDSGLSIQTVINQCGGKYEMSIKLVQSLLKLAPSTDGHWLITGKHNEDRLDRIESEIQRINSILGER